MTTWRDGKKYLSSLWLLDREDERALDFRGAFIPQIAEGLILRHTQPGDWIWDAMAGSGTTGMVAERLGRNWAMSDLSPREDKPHIFEGNARTLRWHEFSRSGERCPHPDILPGDELKPIFQFDLIILHPPYHDIIKFSDKPGDLSNCEGLGQFYNLFYDVVENLGRHLKPQGYLGLVIGDVWVKGEACVEPLGFMCEEMAERALGSGSRLKAIVVKDIKNNRHNAPRKNLMLSRFFRWGAVDFSHEYVFSIQKGK